jgi:3-oxoadipate enol-lactonase
MPFASVNGQQLYFEDTPGNGPVVVFSHGNLMNHDMWAAQVEALRGEFRCVVTARNTPRRPPKTAD